MKNCKLLNLKNMKETIVNYEQCAGWYVDEENACVRDERNCPEGVDAEYKA